MDYRNKKSILQQLAKSKDEESLEALVNEADKIEMILSSEFEYFEIEENIKLLGVFAYRVHEKAIKISLMLIDRLQKIDLKFSKDRGLDISFFEKYHKKEDRKSVV